MVPAAPPGEGTCTPPTAAPHRWVKRFPRAVADLELQDSLLTQMEACIHTKQQAQEFLNQYDQYKHAEQTAKDANCLKFIDQKALGLKTADHLETYHKSPAAYTGNLGDFLVSATSVIKTERQRLTTCSTEQRKKQRKKRLASEASDPNEDPQDLKLEWGEGAASGMSWGDLYAGLRESIGLINATDMESIANSIKTCGWMKIDAVKDMGYDGKQQKALVAQILQYLPVMSHAKYQSRHVYLLDYVNPPAAILSGILNGDLPKIGGDQAYSNEIHEERNAEVMLEVTADSELWNACILDEFADEHMRFEETKWGSKFTTLNKYPDLIKHIKTILKDHGQEVAQGRRRDDKAHVVGLGVRAIRRLLHANYDVEVSHCTVWRSYRPTRSNDQRSVREGGRYGMIDVSLASVRNSQFVKEHKRGYYVAHRNKMWKEMSTDLAIRGFKVGSFHIDDMAKVPLVIDACSHMWARAASRGCTMAGDGFNMYDHNNPVGSKLLMETTGIVYCKPDPYAEATLDETGRSRWPRPKAWKMCDYLRGVPFFEKDTARARHWRDIEAAWLALEEGERPTDLLLLIGDNGSGYDPTDEENKLYAYRFAQKYKINCIGLASYAAGESAKNVEIERPWSQHKKLCVGQRFGQAFLGSRRAPTQDEMHGLFEAAGKEMKDVWENNVNISETATEINSPAVEYVKPMSAEAVKEAQAVYKFTMKCTQKEVYKEENKSIREECLQMNDHSCQTLNAFWCFRPQARLHDMFGPTRAPFNVEQAEVDGKIIYLCFQQMKEKYKIQKQTKFTSAPLQGMEKDGLQCCTHIFRYQAQLDRHKRMLHQDQGTKRRRGQPQGFKRRVQPRGNTGETPMAGEPDEDPMSESEMFEAPLLVSAVPVPEASEDSSGTDDEADDEAAATTAAATTARTTANAAAATARAATAATGDAAEAEPSGEAGSEEDLQWEAIIGASGWKGGNSEVAFQVLYKHDGPFNENKVWLISPEEFDDNCQEPVPLVDRDSLQWDQRIIGKKVFMFWKQKGYEGWYLGLLVAYDADKKRHTIDWEDGSASWTDDLMRCKKIKEWRFVQDGEDVNDFLK
jgi:hypothetical protein